MTERQTPAGDRQDPAEPYRPSQEVVTEGQPADVEAPEPVEPTAVEVSPGATGQDVRVEVGGEQPDEG